MGLWIDVRDELPKATINFGGTEFSEDVLVSDGEDFAISYCIYPHGLYGADTTPVFQEVKRLDGEITHWKTVKIPKERF